MIGRTPEYIGNKVEAREIKLTVLAILMIPAAMPFLTALAVILPEGLAGVIVIVGGLSYLPALALGAIAEQMSMAHGISF
jgi:K+-transporting ATPase A subunit